MNTTVIGIDPGFSGALAAIDFGSLPVYQDMPILKMAKGQRIDLLAVAKFLYSWGVKAVAIEKAQSMPGQGIASTGKYMQSYGELIGLLTGLNIPFAEVRPQTWKKAIMPDMARGKESSIIKVQQIYPKLKFERKKDHGICDAILIGLYGANYCFNEGAK